jgi:aspartate/methionine/tyrosine aminotransferase
LTHFAKRLQSIQPFRVMEILARARAMEAAGRDIIHMEIGEPDFPTPDTIKAAGIRALEAGHTFYTPAAGLPALRQAIADDYAEEVKIDADRIVVTPGASGALQLVFAALVGPGDEVILADPGYPCNRHFVTLFEATPVAVQVGPEHRFQLTLELVQRHWSSNTRAVLVASPSNPTGTVIPDDEMRAIAEFVRSKGAVLIVDEIYRHLSYEQLPATALRWPGDVFVVNSFSKYYGMTGWRLGWLAMPAAYREPIERLAQNLFIAATTPSQYAALAAFDTETKVELERRRQVFQQRRDYLLPALRELGFVIEGSPQGAFYLYADCSRFSNDSLQFCDNLLSEHGIAITPGLDFGEHNARRYVRFSYANDVHRLQQAVELMRKALP